MSRFSVYSALAVLYLAASGIADDLPTKSIQVISSEDNRTKAFLEQGDLLLVELSNPSGNATGMKVDVGKSGLKLLNSGIRVDTADNGQRPVGAANIVLLFEATKVTKGKLKVTLNQTFAKTDPFELEIVVERNQAADAVP